MYSGPGARAHLPQEDTKSKNINSWGDPAHMQLISAASVHVLVAGLTCGCMVYVYRDLRPATRLPGERLQVGVPFMSPGPRP